MDNIYPVTIIFDRYTGAYSKGVWTAWHTFEDGIPEEVGMGDSDCGNFWYEFKGIVGRGDTPDEAYKDLIRVVQNAS